MGFHITGFAFLQDRQIFVIRTRVNCAHEQIVYNLIVLYNINCRINSIGKIVLFRWVVITISYLASDDRNIILYAAVYIA